MKDQIIIEGLEVFYRVGVPDAERVRPQRLLLNLRLELDFTAAVAHDDVRATIDYAAVARRLRTLGDDREWRLIETVAVEIVRILIDEFGAESAEIEVRKFILPETSHVAVRVRRSR